MSGCVRRDPTMQSHPEQPPTASPPPPAPDWAAHADLSAGLAAAVRADGSALGSFAERAAAACDLHARVLEEVATGESSGSAPAPEPASGGLPDRAAGVARAHLDAAALGSPAARLASAGAYAAALAALAGADAPRTPAEAQPIDALPRRGEAQAARDLVAQLHPAIFAAETSLGHLSGDEAAWLRGALAAMREARQSLEGALDQRDVPVPAPAPAYEVGTIPDAGAAVALAADTLPDVLPAAACLVQSAGDAHLQGIGKDVLQAVTVAVARAGGPLSAWPGWE